MTGLAGIRRASAYAARWSRIGRAEGWVPEKLSR